MLLTVDDAFESFYKNAWPIIKDKKNRAKYIADQEKVRKKLKIKTKLLYSILTKMEKLTKVQIQMVQLKI